MSEDIQRLLLYVPGATHPEMITYEDARKRLDISLSRLYSLINAEELHSFKVPHDQNKRLRSDEVEWYKAKRDGKPVGRNPYLLALEALAKATEPQPEPLDTWSELRRYVEQHMAGSEEASQLDTLLAKVAGHVAVTLALSTSESLSEDERARLAALLGALTQKGR